MSGVQNINYRIPDTWSAAWFARFIRDVLTKADARNAIAGPGIAISGTPDIPATISASDDINNLLLQPFVLATTSGFLTHERILSGESGVVTITDNGPNSTIEVGIGHIPFDRFPNLSALSLLGNSSQLPGATTQINGAAQYDVPHIDTVAGALTVLFSAIDHNYISDFNEAAQDAVGNILVDTATIDFTYSDSTPSISAIVIDNSISDAKIRQSTAVSVIGRSANSTGNVADISAATNDTLFQRTGNTLNFGQLTVGMFPNDVVTYAKIQNISATNRVLGRISAGAGDIEELTAANLATIIDTALGANPTASVGLSAVNGSAGTYMRSDAAPALSQTISPTWTGNHVFAPSSGNTLVTAGFLGIGTSSPLVQLHVNRDSAVAAPSLVLGNTNTTNGNGAALDLRTTTTGAGGGPNEGMSEIDFVCDEHNHATRAGSIILYAFKAGTFYEFMVSSTQQFLTPDGSVSAPVQSYGSDRDSGHYRSGANSIRGAAGGTDSYGWDNSSTARDTRFLIYDVDNATLERVTVGVADSGGVGFKVLRIPN